MFGLEDDKKKKEKEDPKNFKFELEKDLEDMTFMKDMQEKITDKIQELKNLLRSGESKEEFDKAGVVLQGYTSLLHVIAQVKKDNK